jgi:hypothetical protein
MEVKMSYPYLVKTTAQPISECSPINIRVNSYGTKFYYLNEKLHREDGPAVEYINGDRSWFLNGKLHRESSPAIELVNGSKEWYLNGELHRVDGPAVKYSNGNKEWYLKGKRFYSYEGWFQALTPEQQYNYLWNIDE